MTVGERIEHCIQEFVSDQIKYTPEANKDILQFIAEILYHSGTEEKKQNLSVCYFEQDIVITLL